MSFLEESIKDCFEYCFNDGSSLNNAKNIFSDFLNSRPQGYQFYYPLQVSWKLTSLCNLRCKHCFYYTEKEKYFNNKYDLTEDEAMNIAKTLVEDINVISFTLTGGEVLLCKYFEKLLKYLKSKNVCINIITNGTLINEKFASLFHSLLNFKYDAIQISLEGVTADVHNKIRGAGAFEKTCRGLKILSAYNIPMKIVTAVTSQNIHQIEYLAEFCKKYNVQSIALNRYKALSQEQNYLIPDLARLFEEYAKLIKKLDNIKLDRNFFYVYDFLEFEYGKYLFETQKPPAKFGKNKLCHTHSKCHLAANGKLYLCPSSECAELCLGDLRTDNFDKIWQNRFNNPLYQPRFVTEEPCAECKYQKWCRCGCAVSSLTNCGNANKPPIECCIVRNYQK